MQQTSDLKAEVGDEWVQKRIGRQGRQLWNWNVVDTKTRYILASYLTDPPPD